MRRLLAAINLGDPEQLGIPKVTLDTVPAKIVNILLTVAGIAAVLFIVIGALRFTISGGDPANVKAARETILYAVIGLVVTAGAFFIVNFVLGEI